MCFVIILIHKTAHCSLCWLTTPPSQNMQKEKISSFGLQITGLPRSMPNADQCPSKFWHWSQCRSIPINGNQFWSIPLNFTDTDALIRHWEELIGNDQHWELFRINAQCRSKSWHWSEMPLNADHCRSMVINWNRSTSWTLGSMPEFWWALISIGHWSRESWSWRA